MKTQTKERPILMSAPMVRAILDGRKTSTIRPVKWRLREPGLNLAFSGLEAGYYGTDSPSAGWVLRSRDGNGCWNDRTWPVHLPLAGERFWVRETWAPDDDLESDWGGVANFPDCARNWKSIWYHADADDHRERVTKWRPSIHMPRWASRLDLEVTADTTVKRLSQITEEEAIADGAQCAGFPPSLSNRGAFAKLWDSIYGDGAWKANGWVSITKFERCEART